MKVTRIRTLVRVKVFNSGNPIPEEDIDKIWVKFYKVDKARTREYGGSGIGLSIVKAIMEAHHQNAVLTIMIMVYVSGLKWRSAEEIMRMYNKLFIKKPNMH